MATTPTNKPIPSEDPRDLKFNAGKIDEEVNGSADYYTDRFSVQRLTNTGRNNQFQDAQTQRESDFQQFLLNSGYQFLGDYENGPYTITGLNQIIRYQNEFWRLNAATNPPYTTTGVNSTSWNTDVTHLVSVGDAALRQELSQNDGVKLIGGLSFVTPEMFKDSTDGSDGAMVLAAWTYVANNGGVLQLLPREYDMGTTRINFPYSETLKPHVIKGAGEKSVLKFGDIPPSGLGPTQNWTKEAPLIQYVGASGTNYIPPVSLQDFEIDYTLQSNKGGTDLASLAVTHPTPYSLGVWAVYFMYALYPKIENVKFNEIYGDGVILRKCTMPVVKDCAFFNVSAGNILTRYAPQNMSSDSNGGCVFLWACHGGLVEGNLCWNKRTYLASVTSVDNGTQIQNTLCGYIGIWSEYPYDQNIASDDSGETAPPLVSSYVTYETVNTNKFNNESLGGVIKNNTVYGYTIGIKTEGLNETAVLQNVVLNCYLTIYAASTRSIIADNWTDMLFCDNRTCPQGGYQFIRGHLVAFNYSASSDGARTGVTMRDNKCYCTNYAALILSRSDITVTGNMFRFARGAAKIFDTNLSSIVSASIIRDNLFFIDSTVTSSVTSNLQYHQDTVFSGNRFVNLSSHKITLAFRNTCRNITLENNAFYGAFFVAMQCKGTIRNNTFDAWTAVSSVYYHDALLECTAKVAVDFNRFRINSAATTPQVVISAHYCTFNNNVIDVQDTGTPTVNAWVSAAAGSYGLSFKGNELASNVANKQMLYLFNTHFVTVDGNITPDTLIARAGGMYAPVTIGINRCGALWNAPPSELNVAANLSSAITPYVGMKMTYVLPAAGGAEGVVFTPSGWKTFGSIAA